MATHNTLINAESARIHPEGIALSLQLPWYRSLWLSAVNYITLKLDGEEIPVDKLTLELEGKSYPVKDLSSQWDTLWFVQEHPLLVAHLDSPLSQGDKVDVDITLELRLLYMQIAPGKYVTNRVHMRETLTVK